VVYLVTSLLQIFHRMFRWKNFENRSIFGEDMDKSMWLSFFGTPRMSLTGFQKTYILPFISPKCLLRWSFYIVTPAVAVSERCFCEPALNSSWDYVRFCAFSFSPRLSHSAWSEWTQC